MKLNPAVTIEKLEAFLSSLTFPPVVAGEACPFSGQPVFNKVGSFDLEDFDLALEELLMFENRVAVVVITSQLQRQSIEGLRMTVEFADEYAIFVSDRQWADRQLGLRGDSSTPGGMLISHVLVTTLMGEFDPTNAPGLVCEPLGAEIMELAGEKRDEQTGRVVWRQQVRIHAGTEQRQLSRQATKTLISA